MPRWPKIGRFEAFFTILNCPTYDLAVFTKNKKPDITAVSKIKSKIQRMVQKEKNLSTTVVYIARYQFHFQAAPLKATSSGDTLVVAPESQTPIACTRGRYKVQPEFER